MGFNGQSSTGGLTKDSRDILLDTRNAPIERDQAFDFPPHSGRKISFHSSSGAIEIEIFPFKLFQKIADHMAKGCIEVFSNVGSEKPTSCLCSK